MKTLGFLLVGLVLLAACGSSTADKLNKTSTGTSSSQVIGDTGRSTATTTAVAAPVTQTSSAVPTPTDVPTPSPTPLPTPVATQTLLVHQLIVESTGFGSSTNRIMGYAFTVQNINASLAVADAPYLIAVYGISGAVQKVDTGSIPVLFPGEQIGVAGQVSLPNDQKIVRVGVEVKLGEVGPLNAKADFSTQNVAYVPSDNRASVTGVVKSPFTKDMDDVRVNAIAYDAAGKIIGGGFTVLDVVPAGGQSAVKVDINPSETPAKVELYATVSDITLLGDQ